MAGIAEAVAGAVQGTVNSGISIWNAYQDYKRFEYQKDLQKEIFKREDNAIQRRVADAEKAGFNKFSVIGEGSSAGSPVSVSSPQIDNQLGSKIADSLSTMYSLATQKAMAKKADAEAKQADVAFKLGKNQLTESNINLDLDKLDFLQGLGYDVNYDPRDRSWTYDSDNVNTNYNSSPLGRIGLNSYATNEANMELKEFENKYKWLGPLLQVLHEVSGTAGTVNSFRRPRRR